MSEVNIKVEIAGSIYPLKVDARDEEKVREAVKLINSKIAEFERNYAVRDKKDVLGMVMLQLVAQLYSQASASEKELSHLKQLLTDVEGMVQEHIRAVNTLNEK
jgi:cell division protein ZapA (FtsZ GTPase activity inhibitor)